MLSYNFPVLICVPTGNMRSESIFLHFFCLGCRCSFLLPAWYRFHISWNLYSWSEVNIFSASSTSSIDSHEDFSPFRIIPGITSAWILFLPAPLAASSASIYRDATAVEFGSCPSPLSHVCRVNSSTMECLRCCGLLWNGLTTAVDTCPVRLAHPFIVVPKWMPS